MQAIDSMTADSKEIFSPLLDIIGALKTILARSEQVTIPDLETSCFRFPNTDQSATHEDQSIRAISTERQQQLDRVLRDISGLETVMDGIQNIHQQLVEKKDRITESMNPQKGLGRLPTEVLSHIFHHCLPESSHPSELEAPLLLSRVCRRWREIAINTPGLWCRLSVPVQWEYWLGTHVGYDLWLKRSRGRPLSLALFCKHNYATMIRSLIQPYINQITSLFITFCGDAIQLWLNDFRVLQELAIQVFTYADGPDSYIPAIEQTFWRLPSTLRSLTVVDEYLHHVPLSSLGSVGAHLTNIDIGTLQRPSAVLHLLQLCPNLSSLKIRAFFENKATLKPFTHTEIQTFCMVHDCSIIQPFSSLFDALSLPSLRVLEVYYVDGKLCPHGALKAFLARSKCPLESLMFCCWNMVTDVERAEYSALIPSLDILLGADVPCDGFFEIST